MKRMKNAAKYSLYILLSTFVLAGCGGGTTSTAYIDDYKTLEIEGCEYMYNVGVGTKGLVHKGNCKNVIHDCR